MFRPERASLPLKRSKRFYSPLNALEITLLDGYRGSQRE